MSRENVTLIQGSKRGTIQPYDVERTFLSRQEYSHIASQALLLHEKVTRENPIQEGADITILAIPPPASSHLFVHVKKRVRLFTPGGRLTFHIFAAVAQLETEIRAERQAEGIAAAKRRGVRFGHQHHLTPVQVAQ